MLSGMLTLEDGIPMAAIPAHHGQVNVENEAGWRKVSRFDVKIEIQVKFFI